MKTTGARSLIASALAGALITVLGMTSGVANADTLIGPNGERLPGQLIQDTGGVLVFQSDFLGRIQVQSDRARVERDGTPAITEKTAVASADNAAALPARVAESGPHWSSDIDANLGMDRGSLKTPEDTIGAAWKLSRKSADGEFSAMVNYKYKKTDGVLKDNDWISSVSYDHFLSADYFIGGRLLGSSDLTSDGYDKSATLAGVWGWRFWEQPGKYLRVGPAVGYLSLNWADARFAGPAVGWYLQMQYPLWAGASFSAEMEQLNASAGNRYGVAELQVKRPVTERLYLALDWIYSASHVAVQSGITSEVRWVIGWTLDPHTSKEPSVTGK